MNNLLLQLPTYIYPIQSDKIEKNRLTNNNAIK